MAHGPGPLDGSVCGERIRVWPSVARPPAGARPALGGAACARPQSSPQRTATPLFCLAFIDEFASLLPKLLPSGQPPQPCAVRRHAAYSLRTDALHRSADRATEVFPPRSAPHQLAVTPSLSQRGRNLAVYPERSKSRSRKLLSLMNRL
jgi:hypothetical protein